MRPVILAPALVAALTVAAEAAGTAYPTFREPIGRIDDRRAYRPGEELAPAHGAARRAEARAARRPPIQEALGLTDGQTDRLEAILRRSADERREAWERVGDLHRRLAEMVEADAPAADLKAQLDRLVAAKRAALRAGEAYDEIVALLGPELTARFALISAEFRVERRSHRPGWRGSADPRWRQDRRRGATE